MRPVWRGDADAARAELDMIGDRLVRRRLHGDVKTVLRQDQMP